MDNNVNKILFDKDKFTVEDLREAAKQIFEAQEEEFYAIKNEKWYKKFLNALSFGSGRNKKIVNDIRSLAKLQTIFALVYYENYKDTEKQINEIIKDLSGTNEVVKKIYMSCVVGVKEQEDIRKMPTLDKDILLLTLEQYESIHGKEREFQNYKSSIAKIFGLGLPEDTFEPGMLDKVSAVETFYRCMVELRIIDSTDDIPLIIDDAIDYLNISNSAKKKIEELVRREAYTFGTDHIVQKYSEHNKIMLFDSITEDMDDIVLSDVSEERKENLQDVDYLNDQSISLHKWFMSNLPEGVEGRKMNTVVSSQALRTLWGTAVEINLANKDGIQKLYVDVYEGSSDDGKLVGKTIIDSSNYKDPYDLMFQISENTISFHVEFRNILFDKGKSMGYSGYYPFTFGVTFVGDNTIAYATVNYEHPADMDPKNTGGGPNSLKSFLGIN